ncbi:hypothetical protein, partial [Effusibacillus pohliae]|uniref:hypothetical protein n=1 Tax=Effusibacillus pohliae TaxID=232270 RepID=UPI000475FA56
MRFWKTLILLVGLSLSWDTTTWAAADPFSDPLLTSPDGYPISNYNWDAGGFFAGFHPLWGLSNVILSLSVVLVRLSMWILDLGYAPSGWLAPFGAIAEAIQKSRFLDHIWPIFAIVAAGVLLKDFAQHHVQRMMQRGVLFVVVAVVLLLFQAVGG